jgi:hypothetical protein
MIVEFFTKILFGYYLCKFAMLFPFLALSSLSQFAQFFI